MILMFENRRITINIQDCSMLNLSKTRILNERNKFDEISRENRALRQKSRITEIYKKLQHSADINYS